ncbi:hypothetical protein GEW_13611 [Pasteurella multocida subsp. gallicida str. Anand1_poultry]|nr:hypothetical protein GEW_13611 [Pasteurella multocida subsp. gallicida str. Anand1_poultry]
MGKTLAAFLFCLAIFLLVVALLLLGEPCMILSSSFWLSVGAVSVLMLWYQIFPLSY